MTGVICRREFKSNSMKIRLQVGTMIELASRRRLRRRHPDGKMSRHIRLSVSVDAQSLLSELPLLPKPIVIYYYESIPALPARMRHSFAWLRCFVSWTPRRSARAADPGEHRQYESTRTTVLATKVSYDYWHFCMPSSSTDRTDGARSSTGSAAQ